MANDPAKTREEEQRHKTEKERLQSTIELLQREREILRSKIVDMEREVEFQQDKYQFEHEGKQELEKRLADLTAMMEQERELKLMFQ